MKMKCSRRAATTPRQVGALDSICKYRHIGAASDQSAGKYSDNGIWGQSYYLSLSDSL